MAKDPNANHKLRAQFAAAHRDGMESLKKGDYEAFGDAIERERAIIEEHALNIAESTDAQKTVASTTPRRGRNSKSRG